MAVAQNLSVLAYANRFTLWHYRSVEKDIEKDGYFNNMDDLLRVHDVLIICSDIAGQAQTEFYTVYSNERGIVRVRPVASPMPAALVQGGMMGGMTGVTAGEGAGMVTMAMRAVASDGSGFPAPHSKQTAARYAAQDTAADHDKGDGNVLPAPSAPVKDDV